MTLRAVSGEQSLRIEPNHRSWSAGPDAVLAWPEPPQLLQLSIPVGYTAFQSFALVVDKVDHGRVIADDTLTGLHSRVPKAANGERITLESVFLALTGSTLRD